MDLKLITRRYIEAFADYTRQTIGMDKAIEEFKALGKIIRDNPELEGILKNPAITETEKYEFIDTVLKKYFSQELNQFLRLLIEKKRISLLGEMVGYFLDTYSPKQTIDAVLNSAHRPDGATIKMLEEKLEKRFQKKVDISVKLDPHIIGGARLEIGNTVIDGSIRGRLEGLRSEIKKEVA